MFAIFHRDIIIKTSSGVFDTLATSGASRATTAENVVAQKGRTGRALFACGGAFPIFLFLEPPNLRAISARMLLQHAGCMPGAPPASPGDFPALLFRQNSPANPPRSTCRMLWRRNNEPNSIRFSRPEIAVQLGR